MSMISPAGSPMRVLVTGFGPFPGMPQNASAAMVSALARSVLPPGIELFTGIVPVVWADARIAAREAIAHVKPHAVLHFGVSKRAAGFEIETRAFNMSGPKADHAGVVRPGMPLDIAGKPILHPALPPSTLLRALRQGGYPAQLSRNAGRYLCNALFYWSLTDAMGSGALVSFIHIPAFSPDATVRPCLTLESAAAGVHVLIRASAQAALRARRSGNGNGGGSGNGSQAFHGTGGSGSGAGWR